VAQLDPAALHPNVLLGQSEPSEVADEGDGIIHLLRGFDARLALFGDHRVDEVLPPFFHGVGESLQEIASCIPPQRVPGRLGPLRSLNGRFRLPARRACHRRKHFARGRVDHVEGVVTGHEFPVDEES
jgi:hypothetical protein